MNRKFIYYVPFVLYISLVLFGFGQISIFYGKHNDPKASILKKADKIVPPAVAKEYSKVAILKYDKNIIRYFDYKVSQKNLSKLGLEKGSLLPFYVVRYFKEGNKDYKLFFSPEGALIGFDSPVVKAQKTRNLSLRRVEKGAKLMGVNIKKYKLVSKGLFVKDGDNYSTFIFKHNNKIEDASFEVIITYINGNLKSAFSRYVVPDQFKREYSGMVKWNQLAALSNIFYFFYFISLIFFFIRYFDKAKEKLLNFYIFIIFIGLLHLLSSLNQLSTFLFEYDTNSSFKLSLFCWFMANLFGTLRFLLYVVPLIISLEILHEKAFATNKGGILEILNPAFWGSDKFLKNVISGYFLAQMLMIYAALFKLFAQNTLGWKSFWRVSHAHIFSERSKLLFPWIHAFKTSLFAGFFEEIILRMVPICLGIILAKRYKNRGIIVLSFLIQAFVFGLAHISYPTLPAYYRLIELIVPSIIFGLIYFRFGIFLAFLIHYLYDYLIFASMETRSLLTLFLTSLFFVMPIILHYAFRGINFEKKNWSPLKFKMLKLNEKGGPLNLNWQLCMTALSLLLVSLYIPSKSYSKSDAVKKAEQLLIKRGENIKSISPIATLHHLKSNKKLENGKSSTISYWKVAFVDRDSLETVSVQVSTQGEILGLSSLLPNDTKRPSLSKKRAEKFIDSALRDIFGKGLKDEYSYLGSSSYMGRGRRDWEFKFMDNEGKKLSAYIKGDRVSISLIEDSNIDSNYQLPEILRAALILAIALILILSIYMKSRIDGAFNLFLTALLLCSLLFYFRVGELSNRISIYEDYWISMVVLSTEILIPIIGRSIFMTLALTFLKDLEFTNKFKNLSRMASSFNCALFFVGANLLISNLLKLEMVSPNLSYLKLILSWACVSIVFLTIFSIANIFENRGGGIFILTSPLLLLQKLMPSTLFSYVVLPTSYHLLSFGLFSGASLLFIYILNIKHDIMKVPFFIGFVYLINYLFIF